jgi:DNA ligase-1
MPPKKQADIESLRQSPLVVAESIHILDHLTLEGLALVCESIESDSSRLLMQVRLTDLIRAMIVKCPDDIATTLGLLLNQIAPPFECVELGVGEALLLAALAPCVQSTIDSLKADAKRIGDLSSAAQQLFDSKQGHSDKSSPSVRHIISTLVSIAHTSGKNSVAKKTSALSSLFASCTSSRQIKLLVRIVQGKLRMGLAEKGILTSLAHAFYMTRHDSTGLSLDRRNPTKSKLTKDLSLSVSRVSRAFARCPSIPILCQTLVRHDLAGLDSISMSLGVPVMPMLARPTDSIRQIMALLADKTFVCEFKYDGERAQIHVKPDGSIDIFSRNLERTTDKYASLIDPIRSCLSSHVRSTVIDGEVVLRNKLTGKLASFQALSTKKNASSESYEIGFVCYDILIVNDRCLLDEPFETRRSLLSSSIAETGRVSLATSSQPLVFSVETIDSNQSIVNDLLNESVEQGCEGLMIKIFGPASTYEPNKRSQKWLKLKKDYLDGMGDTLDLVVCGAWLGKGKRTGTFGSYLVAVYNEDTEDYETVAQVGTGFSD